MEAVFKNTLKNFTQNFFLKLWRLSFVLNSLKEVACRNSLGKLFHSWSELHCTKNFSSDNIGFLV